MLSFLYRLAETHVAAVLDVQLEAITDRQPPTPGPCPRLLVPASLPGPGSRHGDESLADNPRSESHSVEDDREDDDNDGHDTRCHGEAQDQDVIVAITVRAGGRGNDGYWRQ